jgi:AcrR family transcriptional regulator
MPRDVNPPKRKYDSPARREQAARTRTQILDAAQRQFEVHGYPATTMAAIADDAGVSLKTVYLAFETKSRLLRAVWDRQLRGDDDIPVARQPWYTEVLEERDPERKLRLNARNSRAVKERIGGVLRAIRNAAFVDDDVRDLWDLIESDFYANQRGVVETIPKRALRSGIDATRATDLLWTLNHPDVWHLFVDARGWSPAAWEQWFADSVCDQLLR